MLLPSSEKLDWGEGQHTDLEGHEEAWSAGKGIDLDLDCVSIYIKFIKMYMQVLCTLYMLYLKKKHIEQKLIELLKEK